MKYRRLTLAELNALEAQFVRFLVANGIDAPLWQRMKQHEVAEAEKMLDIFSDYVYESAIQQMEYLFEFDSQTLAYFKCEPLLITIFLAKAKKPFATTIDFTGDAQLLALRQQDNPIWDKIWISKQQIFFKTETERYQKMFEYLEKQVLATKDALLYYFFEAQYQRQLNEVNTKN
jgi:hypothetical protein